jgi:Leucine-rich repeat (LRR) protein
MKQTLLILMAVAMVGCGKKDEWPEFKTCERCMEMDIKYWADVCKHCGKDPDGLNGAERRARRMKIWLEEKGRGNENSSPKAAPVIETAIRKSLEKPTGELTKADLEKVTYLSLSGGGGERFGNLLTEVPKGLEKLTQLKYLMLWSNQLTDVKGLEKLTQLTELNLADNRMTSVEGLEKLTQLEELDLKSNQLTEVPKGLEKLTQLKNLFLQRNQLTEVPKELEKLTQLKVLWLSDNKLTDVKGLEKLTQLTRLALDGNQLTDVKGLGKLTQLKYLVLADNNPDLTNAQIAELQKALPNCEIFSNPTK